ncbi:MAG: TonB-dependent receptor [Ginsengibacter sp.]
MNIGIDTRNKKLFYSSIIFTFLFFLLLIPGESFAQSILVTGNVSGTDGQPIRSVSVLEKGTTNGTITDDQGNFSLSVSKAEVTLAFSSLGYNSEEIVLNGRTSLRVTLTGSAAKQLEQVVVIGYGTQKKSDLTGANVSIKGADIANIPALTATQAIQGRVSGVQITSSGAPGSAPNVRIRGVGSILGGADPLYVVDGIITSDIRNINNSDILSIEVLKDASSTAIYGARAANGVLIITTKAGSKGRFSVNYDGYAGVKMLVNKVGMAEANLYTIYSNDAAGANVITTADITGNTIWMDEITRPAILQNHNLSVSGGKNKYRYYLSGGYLNEQGVLEGNNYSRLTLRYNHELAATSKLKFGNNLSFSKYTSNNKPYSVFTQAYLASPIYYAKNDDGTYGFTETSNVGNPLASLDFINDKSYGIRAGGSLWGEYKLTKDLSFRSSFGIDAEKNNGHNYAPVYKVSSTQKNEVSALTFTADSIFQWTWDNYFTYNKTFGDHDLTGTLGHTSERRNGWTNRATKRNVLNDENKWKLNFKDTVGAQQNFRDPIGNYFKRESFFVRVNYKYLDRYLINATFRRDANSNFSPNHRWGNFPSVGIGWLIHKENFMEKQTLFDVLKLRASFGLVGNDVVQAGAFDLKPTRNLYSYFGTDYINGATITSIVDPNLQWEVTNEIDIGLEFSLLDGKLSGEMDYYHKKAKKALYTIPLVDLGFGTNFTTNAADVLNSGFEFTLGWKDKINSHTNYSVGVNATFNKNVVENVGIGKALDFGSLNNGWTSTRTLVGQPIGSFWVFETDGIFQNASEISGYPHILNAQPGDFKIVDKNKDGIIDNQDRVFVGSYQPKIYGGFNASLNWKKLDFGLDIYGNFGNKIYNAKKGVRTGGNYNVEYDIAINRWQPGSNENTYPRAFNGVVPPMDYFIESGSFVRLNNVTVGYTINPKSNLHIDRLRIYASAQNPVILTNYSGFTPELPGNQNEAGIELNIYPISATYMIGVNIQFR